MSRPRRRWDQASYYRGVPTAPYDLVKEVAIATVVILVVVLGLAALLSSPDVPSLTIKGWSQKEPIDFLATATGELQGTTLSSSYGPPYHAGTGSVQTLGPFAPQLWAGVHLPLTSAQADVLGPLAVASVGDRALGQALAQFAAVSPEQKSVWEAHYARDLTRARDIRGQVTVPVDGSGPMGLMMGSLLTVARSGGLDALLMTSRRFYQTDYTRALLFLGDGGYLKQVATDFHLVGNQWGVLNETGRYPGQAWLWLFQLWYQLPPYNTASNVDLLVVLTMGLLSTLLLLVPFIPGLRDIPRWIPIYRLIWREHYQFSQLAEAPVDRPE